MGLDELKREIIAQAEEEAQRMRTQAEEEARAVLDAARAEAAQKRAAADEETRRMLDVLQKRELAAAALESKKLLMGAKKEVLDEVFAKANDALAKLKPEERKGIVHELVKLAATEISIETVYCNARDKEFVTGYKAGGADIAGGIIAENKGGTLRVDYSFETLLAEAREHHLEELGRIVFKA
jgi:V/A-type H+/Na+-transporting ATPase subunit E